MATMHCVVTFVLLLLIIVVLIYGYVVSLLLLARTSILYVCVVYLCYD